MTTPATLTRDQLADIGAHTVLMCGTFQALGRPRIVPVSLADAKSFIALWHRHHAPPIGHKFSIGASLDGELVGVAIVGRPTARGYDDGVTG